MAPLVLRRDRISRRLLGAAAVLSLLAPIVEQATRAQDVPALPFPIVFVSRQIPDRGTIYWDVPRDQPGVGGHSRFRPAASGNLLVRETDGSIRTLIDGAAPNAASLPLIDVNAPTCRMTGSGSRSPACAPARMTPARFRILVHGGSARE